MSSDHPLCSIVIVNFRGAEDTIECLGALRALDWPADRLEVIVVDNASGDGSASSIRAAAPSVKLVESERNRGFAGGCNLGIHRAKGEYVALINSDARPDPGWLREAVRVLEDDRRIGCVASKVLDWDGTHIDYVGGNINFVGQGYKLEAGDPDEGQFETSRRVLFPTGSATVIRTDVFRLLGGFDERFFMFYEDVDLGWRMNLRGYDVVYVPASVVFHRHHAAIDKFGSFRESYLLARNSLLSIYKNFGDETLSAVLAPALLLAVRNGVLLGSVNPDTLDLELHPSGDDEPELTVDKRALTGAYAVDYLARNVRELSESRRQIQEARVRSDAELAPLFGDMLQGTSPAEGYHRFWLDTISAFGLADRLFRRRIVVITGDTLSRRMAGPAIRAYHIAEILSHEHDVKLVSTTTCNIHGSGFACVKAVGDDLRELVEWSDIVIFQGFVLHDNPFLEKSDKIIVVDIYDPMHLEQLEQLKGEDPKRRADYNTATTAVINQQLRRGDFFLCASEEQRFFWLGQLAGVGRLTPMNYDRDDSLRSMIDVAPFGLPETPPIKTRPAIKGVVPGISAGDQVILWGGGVYNWFDPLSVIRAVDQLRVRHDDVRLFFMGLQHPNPNVPEMSMAWEARELADSLGLTDRYVFFNDAWVEYSDRQNYLLDADLGVSAHFLHVETSLSFRTRMLDYLWAGLPIVATEGDTFARLIDSEGLGLTVPELDVDALADALEKLLYDEAFRKECAENVAVVRERFTWDKSLRPLVDFCNRAVHAADWDPSHVGAASGGGLLRRNLQYAKFYYQAGGLELVLKSGRDRIQRAIEARR